MTDKATLPEVGEQRQIDIDFLLSCNYAVCAVRLGPNGQPELLHTCVYENPPSEAALAELREELRTDPEFGLVGVDDYRLVVSTEDDIESVREEIRDLIAFIQEVDDE